MATFGEIFLGEEDADVGVEVALFFAPLFCSKTLLTLWNPGLALLSLWALAYFWTSCSNLPSEAKKSSLALDLVFAACSADLCISCLSASGAAIGEAEELTMVSLSSLLLVALEERKAALLLLFRGPRRMPMPLSGWEDEVEDDEEERSLVEGDNLGEDAD